MTDEPHGPEDEDEHVDDLRDEPAGDGEADDDLLPPDDKGLGLTEEFARIEAEIDAEIGRTGDPLAGAEPGEEEEGGQEEPADRPAIHWDDDDSSEWVVPPLARDEGAAEAGGTEEWAAGEEPVAEAPVADEPVEESEAANPPTIIRPAGFGDAEAVAPAEEPATEHTVVRPRPLVPIGAGGGGAEYIPDEELENTTPRLWWRFMTGSILIVAATATAVALSSLLFLTDVAAKLQPIPGLADKLSTLDPGDPQTILIVGSDKRSDTPGDPGRSDTTMLLRVDAEHGNLSLFSLPRDLKVDIAGRNYGEAKLNEAYTDGGIKKTLATVRDLTGLQINHVVNVDFQGFADAVDAIGCVYVDIDRKYFNDNSTAASALDQYAAIDINSGYQRLCGEKALEYVRYRHTDTDFVRAARQQDFLRNARHQVPVGEVLPIIGGDTGSNLLDIFTKYTSSDITTPADVIGVLKAFLGVKNVPIKEVHFEGSDTIENGIAYVTATPEQIKKAVNEFLGEKDSSGSRGGSNANQPTRQQSRGSKGKGKSGGKKGHPDSTGSAGVVSASDLAAATGIDKFAAFGRTSARRLKFPVYVPTSVAVGSTYDPGSRQYDIKDENDDKQPAYKMVIRLTNPAVNDEYYGVEGTTWQDPPILKDPSETISKDGRDYDLFYDGDRLRMVAFHVDGNSYWVSNTLLQTLDASQMISIAESMQEAHG